MRQITSRGIWATTNKSVVAGIAGQALLLVTGIAAARLLGPAGRGLLAVMLVIPAVVGTIGNCGVPQALVVLSGRNPQVAPNLLRSAWYIFGWQVLLLTIMYFIGLHIYSLAHVNINWQLRALSSAVMFLVLINAYTVAILQVGGEFDRLNGLRTIPLGLYAVGLLVIGTIGATSVEAALCAWVIAHVTYFVWLAYIMRVDMKVKSKKLGPVARSKRSRGLQLLLYGLRGHLGAVSPVEVIQADKLFIATAISSTALGYYVVAQSFSNLPRIVVTSVSQVVVPSLASGLLAPRAFFGQRFLIGSAIAALAGIALILLQPFLIPLLFGSNFSSSIRTAQLLIAAGVVSALRRFCTDCTWAMGHPRVGSIAELIMCTAFVLGCIATLENPAIEVMAAWILFAQVLAFGFSIIQVHRLFWRSNGAAPSTSPLSDIEKKWD